MIVISRTKLQEVIAVYRYWYMDPTAESCDLINRCVIPEEERRFENYPKFLATIDTK